MGYIGDLARCAAQPSGQVTTWGKMVDRRLILHIGLPKTGTTALQLFLRRNHNRLKQQGIDYPDMGFAFHHRFAHAFIKGNDRADIERIFTLYLTKQPLDAQTSHLADLVGTVPELDPVDVIHRIRNSGCPVTVISTETFTWYWRELDWEMLRSAFAGFDVRVIAYLRPQAEFIERSYRQEIQGEENQGTRSFAQYLASYDWALADYDQLLGAWAAAFGADAAQPIPFTRETLVDRDMRTDFLTRIGASRDVAYDYRTRYDNSSHSALGIALLRRLNRYDMPQARRFRLRRALTRVEGGLVGSRDWSLLSAGQRREIEGRYEESNRKVAEQYLHREQLFPDSAATLATWPAGFWPAAAEVVRGRLRPVEAPPGAARAAG